MQHGISIGWYTLVRIRPKINRMSKSISVYWLGFYIHYWDYRKE